MDINREIEKLKNSNTLQNENEIRNFESAIMNILSTKDVQYVKDLCESFNDQTRNEEVMFNLVHAIEAFGNKIGNNKGERLRIMANSIPHMLPDAKGWAKTLHYRILNNNETRVLYKNIVQKLNPEVISIIKNLLIEISDEDPDIFESKVNEVISDLS